MEKFNKFFLTRKETRFVIKSLIGGVQSTRREIGVVEERFGDSEKKVSGFNVFVSHSTTHDIFKYLWNQWINKIESKEIILHITYFFQRIFLSFDSLLMFPSLSVSFVVWHSSRTAAKCMILYRVRIFGEKWQEEKETEKISIFHFSIHLCHRNSLALRVYMCALLSAPKNLNISELHSSSDTCWRCEVKWK